MIVVYTPKGGTPEHYDAKDLLMSEGRIVERATDMKWVQVEAGLMQDDIEALRGVAWIHRKRAEPDLRYTTFDPRIGELKAKFDADEVAEMAADIAANPRASEDDRQDGLRELEQRALDPAAAAIVIKDITAGPKEEPATEPLSVSTVDV